MANSVTMNFVNDSVISELDGSDCQDWPQSDYGTGHLATAVTTSSSVAYAVGSAADCLMDEQSKVGRSCSV